jgi:hypothetical protein
MRKTDISRRNPGRALSISRDEQRQAKPAVALALLLGALSSVACTDPDFNRPELLRLPRVLAVQAEPPQPSFGTATTLRALIYQPPNTKSDAAECAGSDPGPKYQWSWCPFSTSSVNGYECPIGQDDLNMLFLGLGMGAAPQLDLGTGETASLTNPFPAPILQALCKGEIPLASPSLPAGVGESGIDAGASSIFGCRFSAGDDPKKDLPGSRPTAFPVTVRLHYTPPCGSPPQEKYGTPLLTVFTVFLPTDETVPPNQNPVVGDIYINPTLKGSDPVRPIASDDVPDAGSSEPVDAETAYDGGTPYDAGPAYDSGSPDVSGPPRDPLNLPAGTSKLAEGIFPRQKRVGLWLDLPLSSSEFLPRPAMLDVVKNDPGDMRIYHYEQLDVAWFTEAGEFGGEHGSGGNLTGYEPSYNEETRPAVDKVNLEDHGRRNYIAFPLSEDYKDETARFFVVVRDSRGGVTWTSGTATMEERP